MDMKGKNVLGLLFILIGAFVVMKIFHINLGSIFGMLFPFILIGLGILGWSNNKKWIGGILIAIGILTLLSKLGGFILFVLAIGLIVGGISIVKKNKRSSY